MQNMKERTTVQTETTENSDNTHASSVDYQNLKNSPTDSQGIGGEETEDLEFVNPLFKQQPRLFNSTVDKLDDNTNGTDEPDYDKLQFNQSNSIKKDTEKEKEAIEMGVKNYGYMDDKPRPDSWDSSLSVFNPSTPIRQPVRDNNRSPSVGVEMSESPPKDNLNRLSKLSDYSSITDVNPYLVADKDPQYEDLPGLRNAYKNGPRPSAGPPAVPTGSRKANMLYEPTVISQKTSYQKRTSISEDHGYSDHTNYCQLFLTILIGIVAIIALVVAFLLVFGVVSAKKCKECEVTTTASTGKQTGSSTTQKELDQQLAYIEGNLTILQNVLHQNSSITISTLQQELDGQKKLVADLTQQLQQQQTLTNSLNTQANLLKFKLEYATKNLNKLNVSFIRKTDKLSEGLRISNEATEKEISAIQQESVAVKKSLYSMQNNSRKLENMINEKASKSNVTTLTVEVDQVRQGLTRNLVVRLDNLTEYAGRIHKNLTFIQNEVQNISIIEGPEGPRGFNGSRGPPGASSLSSCQYKSFTETFSGGTSGRAPVPHGKYKLDQLVGVGCNTTFASSQLFRNTTNNIYYCHCFGGSVGGGTGASDQLCQIYFWVCS